MSSASFPEMYEQWLVGPLFRPFAEILLDRLKLAGEQRLLDIACGTGIVARLAKERLGPAGRVVGIDVSPPMLAVARKAGAGIEWREGNAAALPVADDERFDVVTCQQGLQFFPDKPAAVREMRRVLAPGGRVGVTIWRSLDELPLFRALHEVAERHLGPVVDHRHNFGDAEALRALLEGGGFKDVRIETVSLPVHFEEGAAFVRLNTMAPVGMSASGKEMGEEERARVAEAIVTESAGTVAPYSDGKALTFEASTNLAMAKVDS